MTRFCLTLFLSLSATQVFANAPVTSSGADASTCRLTGTSLVDGKIVDESVNVHFSLVSDSQIVKVSGANIALKRKVANGFGKNHYFAASVLPETGKPFSLQFDFRASQLHRHRGDLYRNIHLANAIFENALFKRQVEIKRLFDEGLLLNGELLELLIDCHSSSPDLRTTVLATTPRPNDALKCEVNILNVQNGALARQSVFLDIENKSDSSISFVGGKIRARALGNQGKNQLSDLLFAVESEDGQSFSLESKYASISRPYFHSTEYLQTDFANAESTDEAYDSIVTRLLKDEKIKEGSLLSLKFKCTGAAEAVAPKYNLNDSIVVNLMDAAAGKGTAVERLDKAVYDTIQALPLHLQLDLLKTYQGFALSQVAEKSAALTTRVSGRSYSTSSNVLGYVMPRLYQDYFVDGYEVFVSQSLYPSQLLMRLTLIHEIFGHLAQFLSLEQIHGPAVFGQIFYLGQGAAAEEFQAFTHTTAALIEWQVSRILTEDDFVSDIERAEIPEQRKASWKKYVNRFYSMSPREFVAYKARKEHCREEPSCISDEQLAKFFEHFHKLGFTDF